MLKRFLSIFLAFAILFISGATFLWYSIYSKTLTPNNPELTIEKGMTLREISKKLEGQGIIDHSLLFLIYTYLLGKQHDLKSGDYLFDRAVSLFEVFKDLNEGRVRVFKVQIIEGWTVTQIAEYLRTLSFIKVPNFAEEFEKLTQNQEGYLFPETYYFSSSATPEEYQKTFIRTFQTNYASLTANISSPLSQKEIVTLASLIEKETGADEERPLVASVFYNRLKKKIPLQTDPSVIYGLKNFDGNLRKKDLANPHPYNTYVYPGLPPGPICNPGFASLKAALNPAKTDYLFFVSKNDGTHYFSKTIGEHAKAVQEYQLNRHSTQAPAEQPKPNQ